MDESCLFEVKLIIIKKEKVPPTLEVEKTLPSKEFRNKRPLENGHKRLIIVILFTV